AEMLDPPIHWEVPLVHPEAVPTLAVDVDLGGLSGFLPLRVQSGAVARDELIVVGAENEERRRVLRHGEISEGSAVDRAYEVGAALVVMLKTDRVCHDAACGEAHDSDPIRSNPPLGGTLAH